MDAATLPLVIVRFYSVFLIGKIKVLELAPIDIVLIMFISL